MVFGYILYIIPNINHAGLIFLNSPDEFLKTKNFSLWKRKITKGIKILYPDQEFMIY